MIPCSFILMVLTIPQTVFGATARLDNYHLSEKQINRLKEVAEVWKDLINFEKNPCNEFYDFVCTNKEYPLPKRKSGEDFIKELFNTKPEMMTEPEEKYLKFSTICPETKDEEKDEFIKWFKFENIGSWAAFEEKWDEKKFNLPLAIAEMTSYNHPIVFNQAFDVDEAFKTYYQISKQTLININENKGILKSKFMELGVKNPEEVLNDAALFEKTYNEAADLLEDTTDIKIKFSELKDYLPGIDWDKQIEIIYGQKLSGDYLVLLKSPNILRNIYTAISKLSPKTIVNYFFCDFYFNIKYIIFTQGNTLFMPVFKEALMKHLYDENMKQIVKGVYITMFEVLHDVFPDFKTLYTRDEVTKFMNEIFELADEKELENEFNTITKNNNDCLKNYYELEKLLMKRSAKWFFDYKNIFENIIKSEVTDDLTDYLPLFINDPSIHIFQPIIFSTIPGVINSFNNTILTNAQKECFAKQFTDEITDSDMKTLLFAELILKTFSEWVKNYPHIVQEENKILQEYNLSAEKVLVIFIEKFVCNQKPFNTTMTAFANIEYFQKIFQCPVGSQLNAFEKCSSW